MDILKKMFKIETDKGEDAASSIKDEFRKPQWFEEAETDDELFDDDRKFVFQVFTNPLELQKHFDSQLRRLLESLNDQEDGGFGIERNLKEDFMTPGFESKILKEFEKQRRGLVDTDLDGEIYADQLHSLIQRLNPEEKLLSADDDPVSILPANKKPSRKLFSKPKLTDEEKIMGRIHGTITADGEIKAAPPAYPPPPQSNKPDIMTPMTPVMPRSGITPFGGVFDGNYQGPKLFSQSVMTKTIRKPDGSYETTKVTQDSHGNKVTTITRMVDGKKETLTHYDGNTSGQKKFLGDVAVQQQYSDRNVYVTKEGYAMPRNLW